MGPLNLFPASVTTELTGFKYADVIVVRMWTINLAGDESVDARDICRTVEIEHAGERLALVLAENRTERPPNVDPL